MTEQPPLVLVSNRGPVTYQEDGSVKRGTGGLVTALTGLASHRDAIWIASAMTDAGRRRRPRARRQAVRGRGARGRLLPRALRRVRRRGLRPLLQHHRQPDALVHPALPLGPEQRAGHPPPRGRGLRGGLPAVNRDLAEAVVDEIEGQRRARRDGPRLPPLHAARDGPRGAAGRLPAPLRPHPVDPAGRLAGAADARCARRSTTACWPTTSSASTPAPTSATSSSAAAT